MYTPGTCNIGSKEIQKRKRAAFLMLFVTILSIAWVFIKQPPVLFRALVVVPATASALCFYQAYSKFCVFYAFTGKFSFDDGGGDVLPEYIRKDRIKGLTVLALSTLVGLVVGLKTCELVFTA